MATPVYYTGDTWPPITGTAKDADGGTANLSTAVSTRMVAKIASPGSTVIAGASAFCSISRGGTGTGSDGKWEYVWGASDLSVAGTYCPELEVTWDALSTPPKIETFRLDTEVFIVKSDND